MAEVIDLISSDSENEETRLAIQLSLQTDHSSPSNKDKRAGRLEIGIESSEDDDIKQAIELSLKGVNSSPPNRIERVDGLAVEPRDYKASARNTDSDSASRKRKIASQPFQSDKKTKSSESSLGTSANGFTPSPEPVFPAGAIKRTWAFGFPREDDMVFEEVVQSEILKTAVLSSCQWDDDWLFSKVDCKRTKVTLVMDENESRAPHIHQKHKYLAICGPESVSGIMHSKLMLLFYEHYTRLVVPTGNLVPYDWGETGHMENLVFLIDLPYLSETVRKYPAVGGQTAAGMITDDGPYTKFFEAVHVFCTLMNIKPLLLEQLCRCDFSATKDMAFVFGAGRNLSGFHYSLASPYAGLSGLACQVERLGLSNSSDIQVDVVVSSIGNLTFDFVSAIYSACQGSQANAQELTRKLKNDSKDNAQTHMRIYFPSQNTIRESRAGTQGAGTICLRREYWQKPRFPRDMFFESRNVREGLLLHDKIMFVQPRCEDAQAASSSRPWVYVGSGNCSESAWLGTYEKSTPKRKNWECGVIVPAPRESKTRSPKLDAMGNDTYNSARKKEGKETTVRVDLKVFADLLPVPISFPARKLTAENEPWFLDK